jgi:hypothetical protein
VEETDKGGEGGICSDVERWPPVQAGHYLDAMVDGQGKNKKTIYSQTCL